jgi:hypothetical protein
MLSAVSFVIEKRENNNKYLSIWRTDQNKLFVEEF